MIRAADIIAKLKQKNATTSTPPPANVALSCNQPELLDKNNSPKQAKLENRHFEGAKNTKNSNKLQETSTTSHARRKYRVNKRGSLSKENKEFHTTFVRASDIVALSKSHGETAVNNTPLSRASNKCDKCPAAGFWDYNGPGKWCFHTAFYLGKSGKPTPCKTAQHDCPLSDEEKLQ